MLEPISSLPETARVWIYQSDTKLSDEQVTKATKDLTTFLEAWTAHGAALKAAFEIKYNRFITIALDQSQAAASGCSIDSQVRFIQSLQEELQLDLLDKMNVSYKQGEFIAYKPLADFRKMAKNRSVSPNTIVFNNLVTNKAEYLSDWEVPAKESWHNRFLN